MSPCHKLTWQTTGMTSTLAWCPWPRDCWGTAQQNGRAAIRAHRGTKRCLLMTLLSAHTAAAGPVSSASPQELISYTCRQAPFLCFFMKSSPLQRAQLTTEELGGQENVLQHVI